MNKPYVINIEINDKKEFFDTFNKNELSPALDEYILRQANGISFNSEFVFKIKSKMVFTTNEEKAIVDLIRSNYGWMVKESELFMSYERKIEIVLLVVGVLAIVAARMLSFSSIVSELIQIIGWVAIWEMLYNFIFVDTKKRLRKKRYKQLTNAKIEFVKSK